MGGGRYILTGGGWWWVIVDIFYLVVGGGGWWWMVAQLSLTLKCYHFEAFQNEFEIIRGPKIEPYSNEHVDKVFFYG